MKLILDASSLIAFYVETGAHFLLEELHKLGHEILVPASVANEIGEKDESYKPLSRHIRRGVVSVLECVGGSEISDFLHRFPYLGGGEAEVILWGLWFHKREHDYRCVLDDRRARRTAQRFSLRLTGTIGLIRYLEKCEVISANELESLLTKLKASGFRYKSPGPDYK